MSEKYSENMMREWANEPNENSLWHAVEVLKTDPSLGLGKLELLAENGSALSMVELGDAYLYGRGIKQDIERGEQWMKRAASCGSIEGTYRLAYHYQVIGEINKAQAELLKLGNKGFSPAWYTLGSIYYKGDGVLKNTDKAIAYWQNAAKLGHLIAKHWLYFLMRKQESSVILKIKGYALHLVLFIPFVYYNSFYKESDRLRNW